MVGEGLKRPSRSRRAAFAIVAASIAAAVIAVYAQVAGHDFVEFDDDLYLLGNPYLEYGTSLEGFRFALEGRIDVDGGVSRIWQPVTWLSYLVDYQLWGLDSAGPWLLTNVAWHIAAAWALLAALTALTGRFGPSAFAAALFALHPIQVESVAWASGRRDVLAGFFFCTTLWAYARDARRRDWLSYVLVFASTAACLAAKSSLVALPCLLLLLDWWPLHRFRPGDTGAGEPLRELLVEKLPLFGLSAAVIWINLAPVGATAGPWVSDPPFLERAADGVMAYAATLGRLVWPSGLAIVYPTARQQGLPPVSGLVALATGAALLAVAVLAARAGRPRGCLLTGWLWFLGMLFPLIGWVPYGLRVMHDRYAYVPMIGIAVAVSFGAADWIARRRVHRTVAIVTAVATLLACGVVSFQQAAVWRDSLTLFDHALAATERNAIVHFYRGNTLVGRGDLAAARGEFEAALAIQPDYAQALQNLGQLQLRLGNPRRALPLLERAVALQPRWARALTNLAAAQWSSGDRAGALASLRAAVASAPKFVDALYALAAAQHAQGDLAAAAAGYREVLRLDPDHAAAQRGLARLHPQRE